MKNHFVCAILAIILTASVLTGCSDGKQLKQEAQFALKKQQEIKNYSFSGNADLQLDMYGSDTGKDPLTIGLLTLFIQGKLAWAGNASTDPVRLELDMNITPKGAKSSIILPLLIKDNKMYFTIPMMNIEEEFFVIDMDQVNKAAGENSFSPEGLKNTGDITSVILTYLLEDIDPKWFRENERNSAQKKITKTIVVEINEKNFEELTKVFMDNFPQIIDELQSKALLSKETAGKMKVWAAESKEEQWKDIQITEPGFLKISLDQQGFIREKEISLSYSSMDSKINKIHIYNVLDKVNQNPEFQKEIPKNAKSFEEILKFLTPSAN